MKLDKETREYVRGLFEEYGEKYLLASTYHTINQFLKDHNLLDELEVGRWYKFTDNGHDADIEKFLVCYNGHEGYGFNRDGEWGDDLGRAYFRDNHATLATPSEVETALIAEAKKQNHIYDNYRWDGESLYAWNDSHPNRCCEVGKTLFELGLWAEPKDEEMTLKQVCKELGREIKIVK